jgi:NAD(P)-dependent dehydrogenase (short-subunit alcohol dehydrogenase family)
MGNNNNQNEESLFPPLSTTTLRVEGRYFVITGGTQGLGLAIVKQLKDLGAAGIAMVSRSADKGKDLSDELSTDNCRIVHVQADLSNVEEAENVIAQAVEALGEDVAVTGLVNGSATVSRGNLFTTTTEQWDTHFSLNVRAPFLLTQALAKHVRDKQEKRDDDKKLCASIVNISSIASYGGAPFMLPYSASKAAVNVLTTNNAAELAPHGIRVNAVAMGHCYTEREDELERSDKGDDWLCKADEQVPLGRILRPQDVASSVCFLLSDASALMTGGLLQLHPDYAHGMISLACDGK